MSHQLQLIILTWWLLCHKSDPAYGPHIITHYNFWIVHLWLISILICTCTVINVYMSKVYGTFSFIIKLLCSALIKNCQGRCSDFFHSPFTLTFVLLQFELFLWCFLFKRIYRSIISIYCLQNVLIIHCCDNLKNKKI